MSKADELKAKNENLFERNTILLNENERLKKENAELKKKCYKKAVKDYCKLEKENAELKDALKGKRCNCMTYLNFKDLEKELTKAKDLIEDMYDKIPASHSEYYKDVMERARQFLKEIEKC